MIEKAWESLLINLLKKYLVLALEELSLVGKVSKHKLNVSTYTEEHQKVLRKQHSLGKENAAENIWAVLKNE